MQTHRLIASAIPARQILTCLLLSCGAMAQQPASPRPKIGVAFEGGGALGFAHIGVIEWLEEHRIPVDYIAGTSMGGLVGGLYATGMSPAQIRDIVTGLNWNDTLGGETPFLDASFRRKEDRRDFQNGLTFGLKKGLKLPSGLSSGQNITFLLDREVLPYSQLKSFDDLPIPFRCVATDLTSGKAFVFKDGPLGEALRSTMSIPGVFAPVRSDGKLFADGMLMDNLPVDVVKQMGADIVIAVYLNTSPYNSQGNQSLFSVLDRSIGVMVAANEIHSLEMADLLISVDLSGYTSSDFSAGEKIIPKGYDAASKKSSLLSRLSMDEATWQKYEAERESRRIRSVPTPQFVEVAGASGPLAKTIQDVFADNVGQPVDTARIQQDINEVLGIGRFTGFSYHMVEKGGQDGLAFRATEKDESPPILNVGFLVDGSELANVQFTMSARITALDIGGYRSELRTDVSLGATWGLGTEYYKPLGTGNWFVAPRVSATDVPFDLYDRSTRLAEYRIREVDGGLDLGYAIDRFSQIRFGYDGGYLDTSLSIGAPVLPSPSGRVGITSLRYDLDRLDSPVVPRTGEFVRVRGQWEDAYPDAPPGVSARRGLRRRRSPGQQPRVSLFGGVRRNYIRTRYGLAGILPRRPDPAQCVRNQRTANGSILAGARGLPAPVVQPPAHYRRQSVRVRHL